MKKNLEMVVSILSVAITVAIAVIALMAIANRGPYRLSLFSVLFNGAPLLLPLAFGLVASLGPWRARRVRAAIGGSIGGAMAAMSLVIVPLALGFSLLDPEIILIGVVGIICGAAIGMTTVLVREGIAWLWRDVRGS